MMATSNKILEREPSEIEMLLPWHAAGTLNARDSRRVDDALGVAGAERAGRMKWQQHFDFTGLLLEHFLHCHHGQPRSTPAALSRSASFLRA